MENWLFLFFLSNLPGPLSFYTAMENNTIFLQQFFRFRGGGEFRPLPPAGAPANVCFATKSCIPITKGGHRWEGKEFPFQNSGEKPGGDDPNGNNRRGPKWRKIYDKRRGEGEEISFRLTCGKIMFATFKLKFVKKFHWIGSSTFCSFPLRKSWLRLILIGDHGSPNRFYRCPSSNTLDVLPGGLEPDP